MGFFATLNGKPLARVHIDAPWSGPWLAHVMPHDTDIPSGAVQIQIGQLTLKGTVDPSATGGFAGGVSVGVRAGAGAWGKPVVAKKYHNDGKLQRDAIAGDAAREVGEALVVDASAKGPLVGVDFPREAGPASRVLEQLFPSTPWYVGSDGITRVGPRPTRDVSSIVRVLELEQRTRGAVLELDTDDVSALLPGATINDSVRLGATPFVVHDVEINLDDTGLRAVAWGRGGRDSLLLGAFRQLVRESDPNRTFSGLYRYRVYKMSGDRVELQIVRKQSGLPDVLPVSIMPGVAGASFSLTPGCVVLVQFADGDPSLPVMTHAAKKGDSGFLPLSLTLDATDTVSIGSSAPTVDLGEADSYVLRNGDSIQISGAVVPGGSGTVTGVIQLGTGIAAGPAGPPPGRRSRVKARRRRRKGDRR